MPEGTRQLAEFLYGKDITFEKNGHVFRQVKHEYCEYDGKCSKCLADSKRVFKELLFSFVEGEEICICEDLFKEIKQIIILDKQN